MLTIGAMTLASLTLPLAPLGSAKTPFSAPRAMALFRRAMLEGVSTMWNRRARCLKNGPESEKVPKRAHTGNDIPLTS